MPIPLTVVPIDLVHCLLHLFDGVGGTGRKRLLDHRLFCTSAPSERSLQCTITPQAGVHLHDARGSRQDTDKGIGHFLKRRILDGFLRNMYLLSNGCQQIQLTYLDAQRCQACAASKMRRQVRGRLSHGGGLSLSLTCFSVRGIDHHSSSGKLLSNRAPCH